MEVTLLLREEFWNAAHHGAQQIKYYKCMRQRAGKGEEGSRFHTKERQRRRMRERERESFLICKFDNYIRPYPKVNKKTVETVGISNSKAGNIKV